MTLAQKMLMQAFIKFQKKKGGVQITALARELGMPYSTVYNPLMEARRCNADIWLKLMLHFGAIELTNGSLKTPSVEGAGAPRRADSA